MINPQNRNLSELNTCFFSSFDRLPHRVSHINFNLYHYAGNNPVKYLDPDGRMDWDTFTVEIGDTLPKITKEFNEKYSTNYSVGFMAKACGITNLGFLNVGDVLNFDSIIPSWHVTGKGSGVGAYGALIPFLSNLSEVDISIYSMDFKIEETGETFRNQFVSRNYRGEGIKIGSGVYVISIEAEGLFKGEKPTGNIIANSFAGKSEIGGFSFLWVGVSGSESEIWRVGNGIFGVSAGLPFSYGIEESNAEVLR